MAIELSKLEPHPCNSAELEQYVTEGDLAAFWLLAIDQLDDLRNKSVLDLGSGNGVLGLGTAYLGASEVLLIEADPVAHEVSKNNIAKVNEKFETKINSINAMIGIDEIELTRKYDIIIMNPPWGFQTEKADRPLLEFSLVNKPILTTNWSGHIDYLNPEFTTLLQGSLKKVHPSAANNMLLKEAEWFNVDTIHVGHYLRDMFENYKKYRDLAKRQGYYSRTNFSFEKMKEKLDKVLKEKTSGIPKQVELKLPKLKKIRENKTELPKLELPKLKKV